MTETDRQANVFAFTLIAHGMSDLDEAPVAKIFEAGCDDSHIGSRDGRVEIYFERESTSLEAAIGSAILDLKKAGVAAWLENVEAPEQVSTSETGDARAAM